MALFFSFFYGAVIRYSADARIDRRYLYRTLPGSPKNFVLSISYMLVGPCFLLCDRFLHPVPKMGIW